MEHVVVLIGQLVDLSALHLLQLTVDDGGETVPDGDDGRGGIEYGWRLRAASFGFGYASRTRRVLACRQFIVVLQLVFFERHLQTQDRHAVDTINCRQTPIRVPSRNRWWVVIPLLSA